MTEGSTCASEYCDPDYDENKDSTNLKILSNISSFTETDLDGLYSIECTAVRFSGSKIKGMESYKIEKLPFLGTFGLDFMIINKTHLAPRLYNGYPVYVNGNYYAYYGKENKECKEDVASDTNPCGFVASREGLGCQYERVATR